jgi:hypothetical protein
MFLHVVLSPFSMKVTGSEIEKKKKKRERKKTLFLTTVFVCLVEEIQVTFTGRISPWLWCSIFYRPKPN